MSKAPKILYLLSHGHTARGLFQTGLIDKMQKAGLEVVVVAKKDPKGEITKVVESFGGEIDFFDPPHDPGRVQQSLFRAYVHQNIRTNPALWEKHQRRAMDRSASVKRKLLNRFYLIMGDITRNIKPLKKLHRSMEDRRYTYTAAHKLLQKYNPDLIISTRPVDAMEGIMLNAARKLNIKRVMYILSWDNITAKGIFPENADYYLTWGPVMNQELKEYYGISERQLFNTGVTHFDVHAEVMKSPDNKWIEQLGLDGNKPYMFFTMGASYYSPNEIDIIEWLAGRLENNEYGEDMQLVLRPHMHNFQEGFSDLSWKERLLSLQSGRVAIDFPDLDNTLLTWYMKHDDMLKLSNLFAGASVCLNSGSTTAIEAAIMNKPVILTLFDTEDWDEWLSVRRVRNYVHLKKFIAMGGVWVVDNLNQLDEAIKTYLKQPELHAKERAFSVEQECFRTDGNSTKRFVRNVLEILEREGKIQAKKEGTTD